MKKENTVSFRGIEGPLLQTSSELCTVIEQFHVEKSVFLMFPTIFLYRFLYMKTVTPRLNLFDNKNPWCRVLMKFRNNNGIYSWLESSLSTHISKLEWWLICCCHQLTLLHCYLFTKGLFSAFFHQTKIPYEL